MLLWALIAGDLIPEPTKRQQLYLEVVGYEERRDIAREYDAMGNIRRLIPGPMSAYLQLKAPDGTMIQIEIPWAQLTPLIARMHPV